MTRLKVTATTHLCQGYGGQVGRHLNRRAGFLPAATTQRPAMA